jgi:hypothetical protein
MGYNMCGTYFIRYTGNEQQVLKLININKESDDFELDLHKRYTLDKIMVLAEFADMFGRNIVDIEQVVILDGALCIPGNKLYYNKRDLCRWWKKYLINPQCPVWGNICPSVIILYQTS